ncbi:CopG domain protein DNA-binding domain protein [Treponema primitia ZAS-2]|uniref:CopG domain protein DNA-binding domain protein n=1 Tax=Treponema primitia (strain ATCC BAA-887 / DSM 12427 / ZAS-2) TaxID=545694 RepID=F5YPZ2_TREPZ|nr:antitoxin [Treponema primitia]AEF86811.1 CopG domain protein DNA-binding domain protein [Treponema primitia ZAS-2]
MKNINNKFLDDEEKDLAKSIANDEWQSIGNLDQMKRLLQEAARTTMTKDQRMNIRLTKKDLDGIKTRALAEGMPYQTLVSSIIHKYISGQLTEKEA